MNVFLTGGSRGIGKEIKNFYESKNHKVICPNRNELDLSDINSIDNYLSNFNLPIDILINNAGINDAYKISEIDYLNLHKILDTNFTSHLIITKHFLKYFIDKKYGRIINVGSVRTDILKQGRLGYSISKNCLHFLTKYIVLENSGLDILANTISPGYVESDMLYKNNSIDEINKMISKIPLGFLCDPLEIAKLSYFLSIDNKYITGQNIFIDGGLSAI